MDYLVESTICKNKIMNFLLSNMTENLNDNDIENFRFFYKKYLQECLDKHFITLDDFNTYNELYTIIDSTSVNYDIICDKTLEIVSSEILNCYN